MSDPAADQEKIVIAEICNVFTWRGCTLMIDDAPMIVLTFNHPRLGEINFRLDRSTAEGMRDWLIRATVPQMN